MTQRTRDVLNRLIELGVLEHEAIEDTYKITKLYSENLDKSLEHFNKNPNLIKDDIDTTTTGIILLAYMRTVKKATRDDIHFHVAIIKTMLTMNKDKRLDEFAASLRLLERVKY